MALEKFIYTYSVFLFFMTLIISLGAGSFLATLKGFEVPEIPPEPSVWDYVSYPISQLSLFFKMMMVDIGIGLMGVLIYGPAIILLLYTILRLLRGGG